MRLLGREQISTSPVVRAVGPKDAEGFPEAKDEPPSRNREGLGPAKTKGCAGREGKARAAPGCRRARHTEKTESKA